MSRIVIVILIYHRHKHVDSINLLGSYRRRNVFLVSTDKPIELSRVLYTLPPPLPGKNVKTTEDVFTGKVQCGVLTTTHLDNTAESRSDYSNCGM
jgi:hypothetical protein